ncbi:unnamed protein product [Lampetra planeri]
MADLRLGDRFDVVLLGTGLPESIVAAACARVGQSVLHLDRRDYYGGNWASFNLQGLQDWIRDCTTVSDAPPPPPRDKGKDAPSSSSSRNSRNSSSNSSSSSSSRNSSNNSSSNSSSSSSSRNSSNNSSSNSSSSSSSRNSSNNSSSNSSSSSSSSSRPVDSDGPLSNWSSRLIAASGDEGSEVRERAKEGDSGSEVTATGDQSEGSAGRKTAALVHFSDVVKNGRRFNIDLAPNCLYARGSLVELLTKSQVSRYVEFKSITRLLTLLHGHVQQVPCSRADVFSSRLVSLAEKRLLMKLLELALHHEQRAHEYADFRDKPFGSFLAARQLTPNLRHFVVHSIAMTTEEVSTEEGLAATRRFLASLGRYGNTPFLFPLYGSGELPQCFCR